MLAGGPVCSRTLGTWPFPDQVWGGGCRQWCPGAGVWSWALGHLWPGENALCRKPQCLATALTFERLFVFDLVCQGATVLAMGLWLCQKPSEMDCKGLIGGDLNIESAAGLVWVPQSYQEGSPGVALRGGRWWAHGLHSPLPCREAAEGRSGKEFPMPPRE